MCKKRLSGSGVYDFLIFSGRNSSRLPMATWGKLTVINASRVRTEVELSAFGKAKRVSTLQERRGLRDLAAYRPKNDGDTRSTSVPDVVDEHRGSAIPMGATLALVWLATISLVVINYFVPFNLVSLIYMLPVVVAATQWGIGAGILAAVTGAAAADFFFYPPLYMLWIRDPQNVVDLALFLLIALVTSNLAARLRERGDSAAAPRKRNHRAACILARPRHLSHRPRLDLRGAGLSIQHATLSCRAHCNGAGRPGHRRQRRRSEGGSERGGEADRGRCSRSIERRGAAKPASLAGAGHHSGDPRLRRHRRGVGRQPR